VGFVHPFLIVVNQEDLTALFDKLSKKVQAVYPGQRVGPGWLKYEYNETTWDLNDGVYCSPSLTGCFAQVNMKTRIIRFSPGDSKIISLILQSLTRTTQITFPL
jgi:hypothetical protein